jgi:hypothetical protein
MSALKHWHAICTVYCASERCGKQQRMIRSAMLTYSKCIAKEAVYYEKPNAPEIGTIWKARK